MPEKEVKIEERVFRVELDEIHPGFYFPDKGITKDARIVSGFLEGVRQPITVVIPVDEFTEERLKEEIKKKAELILGKTTPIPKEFKI